MPNYSENLNFNLEALNYESKGLSLIIPIYNEKNAIQDLMRRINNLKIQIGEQIEFILVNDGSTDGSKEAVIELISESVQVIHHPKNLGYGAALKTGINVARYDWVAITDADGTYPIERLPELLSHARSERLAMVVGARTGSNVNIPAMRRPAKWILQKLAIHLSGYPIEDINSGLRVMRKEIAVSFFRLLPDGFSFTTTITLAMLSNGHRLAYIPVDYHHRVGRSKIRPLYDFLNFIQLICRTILWFNPLRIFIPLSLITLAMAFLVLFLSWAFMEKPMDVTFGVLFMTSVMVLAVGLLADLIDKRM